MEVLITSNKKNVVLDATMLTALMKCGRYADLQYGSHLQPIKGNSNSLEVGSIIHKFMEIYYRHQMHGLGKSEAFGYGMAAAELYVQGCPHCTNFEPLVCPNCKGLTVEQLVEAQTHSNCEICNGKGRVEFPKCGHPINENPGLTNTPAESEGYNIGWKFALQTCEEYHKFYLSDFWVTLDTEVVRSKILYEDDEVRILWKAKLDWIVDTNQGIFPCDHKTMKQNRETLSINNQFMGQARLMDVRNIFINKIGLQKTLKPVDKFKRATVSYSAARLMEWQSVVLPYYAKLLLQYAEQEFYPPNFNSCEGKYGKCNFYETCSSDPDMREEVLRANFYVGNVWNPVNTAPSVDE